MTKQEVYDKWKHLDEILSNDDFCSSTPVWCLVHDLWQVVKEEIEEKPEIRGNMLTQ
jgi:hypothetical protein